MAPRLVSDAQLYDRLLDLFRRTGFDGASLSRLQDATGLKRSSLYHRFPNGKDEMAVAVIDEAARRFETDILAPSRNTDLSLDERVASIGERLNRFYDRGRLSCLLDTMSVGSAPDDVTTRVNAAMTTWIDTFARLSRDAGTSRTHAKQRATDAVAAIEGALVLARATGDPTAFRRAIATLPDRILH